MGPLYYRIISSLLFIPYLLFAIFTSSDIPFLILITSIIILAQLEFYSIVERDRFRTYRYPAILFGILIVVMSGYGLRPPLVIDGLIPILGIVLYLLARSYLRGRWLGDLSMSLVGIIYLAWMLTYLVLLRSLPDGRHYLFLCFTITLANDIGAYAIGSLIGRHKIMPKISPYKSIEGSIGGLFVAILVSIIVGSYLMQLSKARLITFGVLLGIFGQLGDAIESILKRDFGVKDSSDLIPGHGGVLDVFDSILFTGPVMFYLNS